ncbi:trypco2 family protein [Dactylosporangium siamense]|uniref:Trypsin-co-occurring domain-containing protein n=1 Tax=Dactylosporangium siamense TaxID=685454 RepID=A0A919PJZ2_9ACTN|nr:trypco2 family protein [Dactylosporangium siamense]GIG45344.1 hypothetical protein Dsi01nite_033850 [Dactylosporangium siamense]
MRIEAGTVPVDDLVNEIKRSIEQAGIGADDQVDLRVTAVRLTLRTVVTNSTGAKLEFRVPVVGMQLRLGRKVDEKDIHTIEVELVPRPSETHEVRGASVSRTLVNAVRTIRSIMANAAGGDDPLDLKAGSVEVSFVVTEEGTLSIGLDTTLRDEVTHTLRLELGPVAAVPAPS